MLNEMKSRILSGKTLSLIFVLLVVSACLYSTIINVPGDQPTIQAGIDISVDADTVLVQPGTYVENINYIGKLITVGSLFLTTQDTTYISQTVIDGNEDGSVVTFESGENSSTLLTGFTITNGNAPAGGGISCYNYSSPSLENVTITDNSAGSDGGGIFCMYGSSPILQNVTISGNSSVHHGGGISCYENSSPSLENVTITNNSAHSGGGILCWDDSSPILQNVAISGNSAVYDGGGIYCYNSSLSFDSVNRCNIFLNYAGCGNDLYVSDCPTINVIVDTFTVLQPDDYFAYPVDNFTFDIQNAKIEQVNHDLYVNPSGSNDNSGLSPADPLQTICYALAKIISNSINPHAIHLANGTYSLYHTGEHFPLNCKSYVSIIGEEESLTILDGNDLRSILYCRDDNNFSVKHLTITNGSAIRGGGILCYYSSPSLVNVTINGNSARDHGGGIYCWDSSPSLENVTITNNSAHSGGGIYCRSSSSPSLYNVTITGNSAVYKGGGINCWNNSNPILQNVAISGNSAPYGGGGISCSYYSDPELVNCILWNNTLEEIYFYEYGDPNSVTISYSDIQGGEAGIVTNNNGTVNWLEGNIDEDPLFVGTGVFPYSLLEDSPCIDAGDPDPAYYDPEDPGNPGYALYPAMGTIINDMGAYGGPNTIGWPPVGLDDNVIVQTPEVFLQQNYPNPFNPATTINYSLKENSKVSLNIYNIKGQKVKQLISDQLSIGQYSVVWNGRDDNGKLVSSGIYFYKMKTYNHEQTKKMILIK